MACYQVYLEIHDDGRCMAHVPELPGCFARAPTRDEALSQVPTMIRDYHAWLRRHGEPAPPPDAPIEIEIAGESVGFGPFDPGDAAALLPPDQMALTPEEMEHLFRLMAHSRADLLALVRDLPDEILDWRPAPQSFSIRRLLRHIGNAEKWYVSRLVSPEALPSEWKHDEDMPLLEFLEMERRTAVARLRQLTNEERSQVFYPSHWTRHPEEPWTARKVLRRFLEHEREHTAQVREVLAARRRYLLARLATERANLLGQLLDLNERALTEEPILDDWTIKDMLAHIAAWDRWEERTMRCMVAGEEPDFSALQDLDATNAAFVAEWRDRSLADVLAELQAARTDWVAWLESLPVEEFFRRRSYGGWDWSFFITPLRIQWQHDAQHAAQIAAWREARGVKGEVGHKEVLLATLAAARDELLACAALIPADERATRPVCGEWTLKDVLGHVADWERVCVEGLRQVAAGRAPQIEHVEDVEAWNRDHVEARRNQPWEEVWADLHATRAALLEVLEEMSQADLAQSFPSPWEPESTSYDWVRAFLAHDREHARDLRGAGEREEAS